MRILSLSMLILLTTISHTMIIKDPKIQPPKEGESVSQKIMPPYNPYSIYVPTKELLSKLPADRVMDIAASAYAASYYNKALYFYQNAVQIFPDQPRIVSWAMYEIGFIYFNKRQKTKALDYFDKVIQIDNAPTTAQSLARMMAARIRNEKEYKTFQKQDDIVFLEDKKARSILDKQIAREERATEKIQRQLAKERKRREKEERKALKQAEKEANQRAKEEAKKA